MNKIIVSENAPAAIGPYSHAMKCENLLFTSGQIPLDPETGKLIEGGIEAQAKQVFRNLSAVLAAANMSFSNVVKSTVYLTDLDDFKVVNELYAELFPENPPARSCVQVAALPGGAKIEMDLVASK